MGSTPTFLRFQSESELGKNPLLNPNIRAPDDDLPVLLSAVEALGQIRRVTEDQRERLAELLNDKNESIRRAAVVSLGNLGEESFEQREQLVLCLHDSDRRVRVAAATA